MAACFDYSNNTINSKARGQFPKEICFFFGSRFCGRITFKKIS